MCLSLVAAAQEADSSDLLERLEQLEARIGALQVLSASPEIEMGTKVSRIEQLYDTVRYGTVGRWEFSGYLRLVVDYDRFASQSVISRLGDDPEESLERLDELLAEVEVIVEEAGNPEDARSLLDEAVFFRNQAEAELNGGDTEAALQDMSISESLAQEAARVVGQEPTSAVKDEEGDAFAELKLNLKYRASPRTEHEWTNYVRYGDEFDQERFRWEVAHELSDTSDLYLDNDVRLRFYREKILDDFLQESLFLRYRWKPNKHFTLRLENDFDVKTEYGEQTDEGFWKEAPRIVLEYSWGKYHQLRLDYQRTVQEFLSRDREEFNSKRHRLQQRYDYFGSRWRVSLWAEEQWRDYNKPLDEDDYRQFELQLDLSFDLLPWLTAGFEGEAETRDYDLEEDTNTDYREWIAGPVLEVHWTNNVLQTLRYEWTGRWNDEDSFEGLDKEVGDFDQHRLALETWVDVGDRLSVTFNVEGEWRRYRNGQTGDFEFFLSDFRPISNYFRSTLSSNIDYRLTDQVRLSTFLYYSEEKHDRFESLDLEETTASFEVRIEF